MRATRISQSLISAFALPASIARQSRSTEFLRRHRGAVALRSVVIFASLLGGIAGFFTSGLVSTLQLKVLAVYFALCSIGLVVSFGASRVLRIRMATAIAGAWIGALCWFLDIQVVLAAWLIAASAAAVGSRAFTGTRQHPALAITCGLIILGGLTGWILTLPVHYRGVWLALLLAIVIARWKALSDITLVARTAWTDAVAAAPIAAAGAVTAIGVASAGLWLPDVQADDLGYHLRLPMQLLQDHVYQPQPQHMVWAYAPWLGDTLHGIGAVIAGRDAHGAINAIWLCLIASLVWNVASQFKTDVTIRWVIVITVFSVPMLAGVATGMQTELPATALSLAVLTVACSPIKPPVLTLAVLAGGLLALKPMHFFAGLPLLGYAAWGYRSRVGPKEAFLCATASMVIGLSAYAQAWMHTGNPILPLGNGFFRSPFFAAVNFDDPRWHAGLAATLPWTLTFDTTLFLENGRGALGVGIVAMAGAWLLCLLRRRYTVLFFAASLALLLPLTVIQYARYVLPGLICTMVVIAALSEEQIGKRATLGLLLPIALLNFLLLPAGNWILGTSAIKRHVQSNGDTSPVFRRFAPHLEVLEAVPDTDDGIVLATDPGLPDVARFGRRGRTVSWYDPGLQQASLRADVDRSGRGWLALFSKVKPRWLLVNRATASTALLEAVKKTDGDLIARCDSAELWRLSDRVDLPKRFVSVADCEAAAD